MKGKSMECESLLSDIHKLEKLLRKTAIKGKVCLNSACPEYDNEIRSNCKHDYPDKDQCETRFDLPDTLEA